MGTKELVVRGSELKIQMQAMTEELRVINLELSRAAEYRNGSKTGHLLEAGIKVTVQLKENVKWYQDRLAQVKTLLPDVFNDTFVYEFKPASSKALETAMKDNEEFAKAIAWSREIKPGAPQVVFEKLEDECEIPF
jgi:predicted nucleic-acid-binding protein